MSQFLSRKYLEQKAAAKAGGVDRDANCPACGYNLRGLPAGRSCPECGQAVTFASGDDLFAGRGAEVRDSWRWGLTLAIAAVGIALVSRVTSLPLMLLGLPGTHLWMSTLAAGLWVIAVWRLTPKVIEEAPRLVPWRWPARWLALAFVVGFAGVHLRWMMQSNVLAGASAPWWVFVMDFGGRLLGGLGVILLAFMLQHLAERAELDTEARRIGAAAWLLWIPTLLLLAFGGNFAIFGLVLFVFSLIAWAWVMVLLLMGLIGLQRHVTWAEKHVNEGRDRQARIDAARRELDAEARGRVRPMDQ